jgi:hypothetical protein
MLSHECAAAMPVICCDYAIYSAPKDMRDLHFSVNLHLEPTDMLHFIIIALFVLLLLSVGFWMLVYRQFEPKNLTAHPLYKLHQVLVAVIAFLIILLTMLVVLSSDPGEPENYWFWP